MIRIKIAAAQTDDQVSNAQLGAMGIAAASPFAGLIGEKPIVNDPLQGAVGAKYKNLEELSRAARPGDVLMTSKPGGSMFKNVITPTGRSQFYHAQPVTGRQDGIGYTMSAGDLASTEGLGPRAALQYDTPIAEYLKDPNTHYPDAALLRPKTPLTKAQLAALAKDHGSRVVRDYDNDKAVSTFFRDMFIPKLDMFTKGRPETICEGNVCSTLPAQSHFQATGRRVVPGKASQDVFPTDFMRSPEFELVGSHVTDETAALEHSFGRKIAPWALRGGLGLGLAGGTYAATENPNMAGAGAGAYAANRILDRVITDPKISDTALEKFPDFFTGASRLMDDGLKDPEARKIVRGALTRRLPIVAAGGLAGYGATKMLGNAYNAVHDRFSE